MRQTITSIVFLFFLMACSVPTDKSCDIQSDTFDKDTTAPKTQTIKLDTFQIVDSLVRNINLKIKDNRLTKKTEILRTPDFGSVYGYFNSESTIEYLFSIYGGEFGGAETRTTAYYKDGIIIYGEYCFYWNNVKQSNARLVARKIFYLPNRDLEKDTILVFNDQLKPPYPGMEFKKSEIPTAKQFVAKTITMQSNLEKYGK